MKILQLCPQDVLVSENSCGGIEIFMYEFDKILTNRGHENIVLARGDSVLFNDPEKNRLISAIKAEDLSGPGYMTYFEWTRAQYMHQFANEFQTASSFDGDIIHSHATFSPLVSNFIKKPIVVTLHDPIEWLWERNKLGPFVADSNVHIVALSESQKKDYESKGFTISSIIPHGIVIKNFPLVEEKSDYLLSLGRISPEKGQDIAVEIAKKSGKDLIIAGAVGDEVYFNTKIKPFLTHDFSSEKDKLSAYNSVKSDKQVIAFVGLADLTQKVSLYQKASAFLLTTTIAEAFGLVTIESLSCGTPVIAFNIGATTEIVNDGIDGFIVDSNDGFVNAISKLDSISPSNCRLKVESRYTLEKEAEAYEKLYSKLI